MVPLFGIGRDVLDRVIFPLGEKTKDQVRAEALRFGLPVHDKPDSVEICFVPDRDYARVVRERRPESFVPGDVIDPDGRANLPRSLAVFVGSRVAGFSHPTIKQAFGIHSDSAVTRMCDRMQVQIARTPCLQHLLQTLELR